VLKRKIICWYKFTIILNLLFQTETVQTTLREGEISTGCQLFVNWTKVSGTAHDFNLILFLNHNSHSYPAANTFSCEFIKILGRNSSSYKFLLIILRSLIRCILKNIIFMQYWLFILFSINIFLTFSRRLNYQTKLSSHFPKGSTDVCQIAGTH